MIAWLALALGSVVTVGVAELVYLVTRPPDPLPPAVRQAIVLDPPKHGSVIVLDMGEDWDVEMLAFAGQEIAKAVGHKQFVVLASNGGSIGTYGRDEVVAALRQLAVQAVRDGVA